MLSNMSTKRVLMRGHDRLAAVSSILQQARLANPHTGIWDAADIQWWWRRPRVTDDLELPVWVDESGQIAAVGLSAWGETWQTDVFISSSAITVQEVWAETMAVVHQHSPSSLRLITPESNTELIQLALESGFVLTDEKSGTTWMKIAHRPQVKEIAGFTIVDRTMRANTAHPMTGRNGDEVESRLNECSLYDATLDLAVEDEAGNVAAYALFWFDPITSTGMLEPLRVEEDFQRRGLASYLIAAGLERLASKGAHEVKVAFESEAAAQLYLKNGFVQTSVDLLLTWNPEVS
jgi:predicted N-acetyltransferase YhbS